MIARMFRAMIVTLCVCTVASVAAFTQSNGKYVNVNGMKMYYEVSGEGDPLIVLHGAHMDIKTMGKIIPLLAETHKVYALEFQGHGSTEDIDRPITYQNLADDVAAFMDAVGLKKADVFGYSMGAQVGLQLAIRNPAKVNKLVSASASYDLKGWQPVYSELLPQMSVEMFLAMPYFAEVSKKSGNPERYAAFLKKMIALEHEPMAWEEDVKKLKTPVLIIAGDADVATLEHTVSMFRLLGGGVMGDMGRPLPASRLAIMPATSHTAVISQPDLLISFIEPFLKGETPKGFFDAAPPEKN
ncbi:MAG: alpha/beta hydrolase [Ignavibacteriae bacterium]|nr:alpha/beta hydrolase [Ignavibacteriota bacterium]